VYLQVRFVLLPLQKIPLSAFPIDGALSLVAVNVRLVPEVTLLSAKAYLLVCWRDDPARENNPYVGVETPDPPLFDAVVVVPVATASLGKFMLLVLLVPVFDDGVVITPCVVLLAEAELITKGPDGTRMVLLRDFWEAHSMRFRSIGPLVLLERTSRKALTELPTDASLPLDGVEPPESMLDSTCTAVSEANVYLHDERPSTTIAMVPGTRFFAENWPRPLEDIAPRAPIIGI